MPTSFPQALKLLAILLAFPFAAAAQAPVEVGVVPTDAEWAQSPPYCRARFTRTLNARGTKWADAVSRDDVRRWEQQMGGAWDSLHHYCYGLIQMSRAPLVPDAQSRGYLYRRAVDEFEYAFRSSAVEGHPFKARIAVQLALVYRATEDYDRAMAYALQARELDPGLEGAYSARAMLFRDRGELDEAAATLEEGLAAITGESAELNYFLGLTYLDLGRNELARQHAEVAYRLGYPLPGLRNRLARQQNRRSAPPN